MANERIFRWDLDKTYLRTEFDTVRELIRIAFESAHKKRTVPGAPQLMRELQGPGKGRIYIVSGSPEQLRGRIESKLRLDGITWDHLMLKPQLGSILRGRFRQVKDQLGYKLEVLLKTRIEFPADAEEYFFGDDAEIDAFVYSLYSDLGRGLVSTLDLRDLLLEANVYPDMAARILRMAERVPHTNFGRTIFIHLDRISEPKFFRVFGPRVVPVYNYFQTSLVLFQEQVLSFEAVCRVASDMIVSEGFTADALLASTVDAMKRSILRGDVAATFANDLNGLEAKKFFSTIAVLRAYQTSLIDALRETVAPRPSLIPAAVQEPIQYRELLRQDNLRVSAAKLRSLGKFRI